MISFHCLNFNTNPESIHAIPPTAKSQSMQYHQLLSSDISCTNERYNALNNTCHKLWFAAHRTCLKFSLKFYDESILFVGKITLCSIHLHTVCISQKQLHKTDMYFIYYLTKSLVTLPGITI